LEKTGYTGKASRRMVAVVTHKEGVTGKRYRTATDEDLRIFHEAEDAMVKKREALMAQCGIDPIPDEPLRATCYTEWMDSHNSD